MVFTQAEFVIFFVIVLVAAWACRERVARNTVLLAASYYFYAYWDIRFCGLLLLSTFVDDTVARKIESNDDQAIRKRWLVVSLVFNLGILGFFKYCNFFIDSASAVIEPWGWSTSTLPIILPVGISFYTFQTMSYTIDVYRRRLHASNRPLDFALYVAFFPQLVAGPIVRASELLPQLASVPTWSGRRFYGGFQQLLRGAVKKVLIADRMGEMVDVVFAGPDLYSGATLCVAIVAYTGQIYYDFSGYTDMAIGAAKMLGYRFPNNFRHPYLATSISDFWRRWHMTLSRWLRDYVYIPLGGSRFGSVMTYRNLMLTMGLGGLWHGAAWTFVLWGLWHGGSLAVHRAFRFPVPRCVGWVLTMGVVMIGWILFRSPDLAAADQFMFGIVRQRAGIDWFPPLVIAAITCMVLEHAAWTTRLRLAMRLPADAWYSPIATTVMLWALVLYSPRGFQPFVYFQF
ncbi:Peptidoglycan O-acetyltransferase [Rubripirellula tenax]|uniref:Peptidoglycan O-acetyltransferase n=1 Tax=Rubripirellula tenax TaxID=2528015 RepID=A0A5C6F5N3_9BACT|nr:MBOAT family protein [Rubripirellula tenax]TWU56545.1 Peptidoglycan O-acetyltransferase [Rubripirellula tenax]